MFAMPSAQKLDTHHKALTLNLDPSTFGSFAEIGAGQEVARWFLLVGGASGTVAKTISAYDKEVSDAMRRRLRRSLTAVAKWCQKSTDMHQWTSSRRPSTPSSEATTSTTADRQTLRAF